MNKKVTRRDFLTLSAQNAGAVIVSSGIVACGSKVLAVSEPAEFVHGIASGDPTAEAIIIWTRVTPERIGQVKVSWQMANNKNFKHIVQSGSVWTDAKQDYTVKIDVQNLNPDTTYYYRFITGDKISPIGKTKTLPLGDVSSVKLAVFSCSNYPAGYFHVYDLATAEKDLDAVLHLGDYIYEYGHNGYASEQAEALNRVASPQHELLSLTDYRTRYAQYRQDNSLQSLHAQVPFICVWDDHEIANDSWRHGAQNHGLDEGNFNSRRIAAMQAYFEWLPIREQSVDDNHRVFRQFRFGELVNLLMLDTRHYGRDQQLKLSDYVDTASGSYDDKAFRLATGSDQRTMLGLAQRLWLQDHLLTSTAKWQVLGQQVIMGNMELPVAIATRQLSIAEFAELATLAQIAARAQNNDPTLTNDELDYLSQNQHKLTPKILNLLSQANVPYNLDAWDGYAYERELIYATAKSNNTNLVVLAGDTHNAWANTLSDAQGDIVGLEFATASVSSPGIERALSIKPQDYQATEEMVIKLIQGVKYTNLGDRGFMTVTFTKDEVQAQWFFVNSVVSKDYHPLQNREAKAVASTDNLADLKITN